MDKVTQSNAANAEESASASKELNAQAEAAQGGSREFAAIGERVFEHSEHRADDGNRNSIGVTESIVASVNFRVRWTRFSHVTSEGSHSFGTSAACVRISENRTVGVDTKALRLRPAKGWTRGAQGLNSTAFGPRKVRDETDGRSEGGLGTQWRTGEGNVAGSPEFGSSSVSGGCDGLRLETGCSFCGFIDRNAVWGSSCFQHLDCSSRRVGGTVGNRRPSRPRHFSFCERQARSAIDVSRRIETLFLRAKYGGAFRRAGWRTRSLSKPKWHCATLEARRPCCCWAPVSQARLAGCESLEIINAVT